MCRINEIARVHSYQLGASRRDGIGDVARRLIGEGASPFDRLEAYRGKMLCLSGTMWRLAGVTVMENATQGPRFTKWRPYERTIA